MHLPTLLARPIHPTKYKTEQCLFWETTSKSIEIFLLLGENILHSLSLNEKCAEVDEIGRTWLEKNRSNFNDKRKRQ